MRSVLAKSVLPVVNTVICLFIVSPIVVAIGSSVTKTSFYAFPPKGISLKWYDALFHNDELMRAAVVTLKVGVLATLLATILGVPAAIGLTKMRASWRAGLNGVLLAPLLVPAIVAGIGMLIVFSKVGLTGTFKGIVLAHTVLVLPYVVLVVFSGLQALDRSAEDAARSLGAGPIRAFCEISLVALRPSLIAAMLFAFIASLDETVVTLFLVGPTTSTLPVSLFHYIQYSADPIPAALATVMIVITAICLFTIDRLVGLGRVAARGGAPQ